MARPDENPRHPGQSGAAVRPHHRLPALLAGGGQPSGSPLDPVRPNTAWSADMTYIPTADGWLYLAVVEDLFSRRIVGWSMDATMTSRLVVDALDMALRRRFPRKGCWRTRTGAASTPANTTNASWRQHGITWSMSWASAVLGQRAGGELLRQPEAGVSPSRAVHHPRGKPRRASSSTSKRFTTASAGTPPWGICLRRNSSGRTTRTTLRANGKNYSVAADKPTITAAV